MKTIEELARQVMHGENAWRRLVLGGVISFVPLLNILSLGYIYRALVGFSRRKSLALPSWERVDLLLVDSVRCFLLWLVFYLLPVMLAAAVCWLLNWVLPSFAFMAVWLPCVAALMVAPVLFAAGLYLFQKSNDLNSLRKFPEFALALLGLWHRFLLPVMAYWGGVFLFMPFYGFIFFVGTLVLVAYCFEIFEKELSGV